jgi:thiol-disulfide isomerase/thioredoxin
MNKNSKCLTYILLFAGMSVLNYGCKVTNTKNEYLQKVLSNLDQIKSATYFSTISGSAPGDTIAFATYNWYNKEYANPADTFIGSSFAWFQPVDTSKMYFFYDGIAKAYIDSDIKTVEIDSFQTNTLPFRPIGPPFFNYTKSIIKYALETHDSITTSLKDFGDSVKFSLYIPHKVIEFFGKPVVTDDPDLSSADEFSRYDIWINKSDNLPYRYRRNMSHGTSWETCKNVELNKAKIANFIPSKYFPPDYNITVRGKQKTAKIDLVGKAAPDWILIDFDNNPVALKDLKSKVLMIQFTGIGCGPCHASISFLKQLVVDYKYKLKDFEFISIETWSKNIDGIERYYKNNGLNYRFLLSTEEITKDYQVMGVPVFYILDENRVIRKIIWGYGKGTTDKEIKDAIDELI